MAVVVVVLVWLLIATAGVSPGEKLRVSAADPVATASAAFGDPAIVIAASAMNRGVGM